MYKNVFASYKLISRPEYRECNIPEKEKKILCEEGLPENVLPFLEFNTKKGAPIYLENAYPNNSEFKFIIIGYDYEVPICIGESNEVVEKGYEQVCFVNSNLESLLECVAIFLTYQEKLEETMNSDIDEEGRIDIIKEIKQKFNKVDSRALENDEHFWPLILEQVEDGLL